MTDMQRYPDLRTAGRELASSLEAFAARPGTLVIGIVRGGVPIAAEVARTLSLPLDVILLRRLMVPYGPTDPLIAAWAAGTFVIDERVHPAAAAMEGGNAFLDDALSAFAERNRLCRGAAEPLEVRGQTIVLVDTGARTGGTLRASARTLRTLGAARIIAALPLASVASRDVVHAAADEVVCLKWIDGLGHVGLGYRNYAVPAVEDIRAITAIAAEA